MEIKIIGEAKEIAALILAVQERRGGASEGELTIPYDAGSFVSQGLQDGFKGEKFVRLQNNSKVNK